MDKSINANKLFWASCVALIVTAMTFGIRSGMLPFWGAEFGVTNAQLGIIAGTGLWGFALAQIFGGPLCDVVGMKKLMIIALVCHVLGIVMTVFSVGFWSLFISTLILGIANGMVEAACNPLITTLYPSQKTEKLNLFHLWYPGGIVIGTLVGFALQSYDETSWKAQMLVMLIPTAAYGIMIFKEKFPLTERVASGVSTSDMFKSCLKPLFLIMMLCMFVTASTEFGVNGWVPTFLQGSAIPPLLLLMWVALIMTLSRAFLGSIVHRTVSSEKVLLAASVLTLVGIYWLSAASGTSAFVAAVVFGIGISFFWPTMLGFVAENLPKTGALGLSIMGGAGMLAAGAFALPILGSIYDANVAAAASGGLSEAQAILEGGSTTLRNIVVLPIFLIVVFIGIVIYKAKNPTIETLESAD